jgi:hypothetical protein
VQRAVHTLDGPLHESLTKCEQAWNDRLDGLDDYLSKSYNDKESGSDT